VTNVKQVFIGSSHEALPVVDLVRAIIERCGMAPLPWNDTSVFGPSDLVWPRLEQLSQEIWGAVLLATPDETSRRGDGELIRVAVPNVVFEYAYLAARLRPQRVALCKFEGVIIPSDLHGLTTIQIEPYVYTPSPRNQPKQAASPLPTDAIARLEAWLAGLSPVAANVPSAHLLHGYSGTWRFVTEFRKWHDYPLQSGDRVTVSGTMFLQLNADGRSGSGTMFGITEVKLNHGSYHAWYRFDNDIEEASINDQGQLKLDVRIVERARIGREGHLPEELKELEYPLPGGGRFPVTLEPDLQKPGVLKGTHSYALGIRETYSEANEQYSYAGSALRR
jgi:hypothetical protein